MKALVLSGLETKLRPIMYTSVKQLVRVAHRSALVLGDHSKVQISS